MKFWPLRKPPDDPLVRAYLAKTPRRLPGRTPLEAVRFVVIDAETTGFDTTHDRMLSLSAVPLTHLQIAVSAIRAWLIRQPAPTVTPAVTVHGILPSETADGSDEPEVLRELLPLLHGAVLVGHHVRFDAAMLDAALRRHFGVRLRNPFVDTALLAMSTLEAFRKTGYPNQRPPALEEVCARCGFDPVDRHTAVGDAFTTAEIFLLLVARLRHLIRRRPLRLGDLLPSRL